MILYNSGQKLANEEKDFMTNLFIKLLDIFMKEMKRKLKWKCKSISTGGIKIYLRQVEPKLSQF